MSLERATCPACDGQQAFTCGRCNGAGCQLCIDGEVFCQGCAGQGSVVMPAECPQCNLHHGGDLLEGLEPVVELCPPCSTDQRGHVAPTPAPDSDRLDPSSLRGRGVLSPPQGVPVVDVPVPGPGRHVGRPGPGTLSAVDERLRFLDRWRRRGDKAKPCRYCGTLLVFANEPRPGGGLVVVYTDSNGRRHACDRKQRA